MEFPSEIAWLIPIVIPFILGLLVGIVIKRTLKLIFAVAALVVVLVATGTLSLTFRDIYDKAMEVLPELIGEGGTLKNILPYSSAGFLLGLALALWRG